jgi:hypothetical protein
MTFVKSAPKKSFSQKTILPIENIGFLGKTFVGCSFYYGHMYIFEISRHGKTDFLIPHST